MKLTNSRAIIPIFALSCAGAMACGDNIAAPGTPDGRPAPDAAPPTLTEQLTAAGFVIEESETREDGATLVSLRLDQLNDHNNPAAGTHPQHLTMIHRGFDRPMNIVSTGYQNYFGYHEIALTTELQTNQITLDKRFHNGEGSDWSLFTRTQVAADAHDVITRLKAIYTQPWVSSGFSNGGVDVVNFRSLYPNDVVGTVALGSPFMSPNDMRYLQFFLDREEACQSHLEAIQFAVLGQRRAAVEPLVAALIAGNGDTTARVGAARAYEAAGLSYPWLFWQYWGSEADCAALPDLETVSDADLAAEFYEKANVFGAFPMSDQYLSFFGAFFYEVQQDSGWPMLPRAALEAAELIPLDLVDMERGLVPTGVTAPTFDQAANDQLKDFAENGNGVIFVYSNNDPWSYGAVQPTGASGNLIYYVRNGNHNADITELSEEERAELLQQMQTWIGQ